jgi:hypothetical protein
MTNSPIISAERAAPMLGVAGRFFARTVGGTNYKPGTFTSQKWISERRKIAGYGKGAEIQVKVRFDDDCRNGHNTFAITGDITAPRAGGRREWIAGGCCHDDIAKAFPELEPLIKWHLTSSDGPMHYIANTVYLAGDRDHWGKREGEPRAFDTALQFGKNPIKHKLSGKFAAFLLAARAHPGRTAYDFEVIQIDHDDRKTFGSKFTFGGYGTRWHECPFDSEEAATDFLIALQTCEPKFVQVVTAWGEGKKRELDAARRAAVWPDASDAELSVEPDELKAALAKRHPYLMANFRGDMESAGFVWSES